jgi:hypothetical protein
VPHSWGVSLLIHLISLILGALGIVALATGQWLAGGLLLSYWAINGRGNLVVCRAALERLFAHGCTSAQHAWAQALWAPVVMALALVNIAASLTTRRITWRGISYTMRSPQHVIVHRKPPASTQSSEAS